MRLLKLCSIVACVALMVACTVSESFAQRGGGRRGGGMRGMQSSPVMLLGMEEVREELKLEGDAMDKLADLAEDFQADLREEAMAIMQDAGDDREGAMKELAEVVKEMSEDVMKEVKGMLNDKQMKRLNQLHVQRMGVNALMDPTIKKELKITDEQTEKIEKAMADAQSEMREAMMEMRDSGNFDREAFMEMRQESQEKMAAIGDKVLNDEQKKKLKEMKGEKFEFPQGGRGRGR